MPVLGDHAIPISPSATSAFNPATPRSGGSHHPFYPEGPREDGGGGGRPVEGGQEEGGGGWPRALSSRNRGIITGPAVVEDQVLRNERMMRTSGFLPSPCSSRGR